jgi:hypothetical protein
LGPKSKRVILAVAGVQLLLALAVMALPEVVLAVPGRYRVALSERSPFLGELLDDFLDEVAPAAVPLPVPQVTAEYASISIPSTQLALPTPEPSPPAYDASTLPSVPTSSDEGESAATPTATPEPLPTETPAPTPTPIVLPESVILEGISRIQQSFNNCGPANLTQVLNWYGDSTTQAEAAAYLKPNPEDRNVSPWQLNDYVNDFTDLRSTVHSGGTIDMVRRFIAAGFPVVIEKGYEPDSTGALGWFGHYLTVFGYDDEARTFQNMDTYLRVGPEGRADPFDDIEYYWQQFNYTFYVVYRPEQEAEVFGILGPDLLDPLKMWELAALRAQDETAEDPENVFAWFNLGTSLTRMGELTGNADFYQNGAAAFDRARAIGLPPRMLWYEFRPYLAYMKVERYNDMIELSDAVLQTQGGRNVEETYLYRGHALLFLGQVADAVSAYRQALSLNENFYPAEIALQSVGG